MKIKLLSDLHVDVRPIRVHYSEEDKDDIVILPGDLAPCYHERFGSTLRALCKHVKMVLFVPGNHEFYGGEISGDREFIAKYEDAIDNLLILDNKSVVIDDVKFIGSTLWTDMNRSNYFTMHSCKQMMNDFYVICNIDNVLVPEDTVTMFNENIDYIRAELAVSTCDKNIVITHHAPSYASIVPKFAGSIINGAFASELSHMILDSKINYWVHGHMHSKIDYMIGDTRVLCNPRGYNDIENPDFDLNFSFEI